MIKHHELLNMDVDKFKLFMFIFKKKTKLFFVGNHDVTT